MRELQTVPDNRRARPRRLEDQLLQALASDADEVLSVVSHEGLLSYVTPASERLFGWPTDELRGQPADALFHPDDLETMSRPAADDRRATTRARCRHRDGSWREVEVRVRSILSLPGFGPVGMVILSRDVTEHSATYRELRERTARLRERDQRLAEVEEERDRLLGLLEQQYEELQRADRIKKEFLQTISHELRTPLTAIMGFSDLLAVDAGINQRGELDIIRRNGRRLLDIVDDMITLARAEAGELELVVVPVELVTTVGRVVQALGPVAELRNLSLEFEGTAPEVALADERAVEMITRHLVDNAIKFTREGGVHVSVRSDQSGVRVAVSDTGPGIPEANRAIIFQGFTQGDQSVTRRHGGMGIGLAVARRLTQLMQGELGLEDRPGGGSTFWFKLPGG